MTRNGRKRLSPSFGRYWAELRIVRNKVRSWRRGNPNATPEQVRAFEAECRARYRDNRKGATVKVKSKTGA